MNLCERHKLFNKCVAGDNTKKQEKCDFYESVRGGKQCISQRFDEYCSSDEAKEKPFDATNLGD
jgi:hypothetical protein